MRQTTPQPPVSAETALRQAQTITFALMFGLMAGGGVLGFMGMKQAAGGAGNPAGGVGAGAGGGVNTSQGLSEIMVYLVPGVWVGCLVLAMVLPPLLVKGARRAWESRADDEMALRRVWGGFVSMQIAVAALLEGPGLLGAVATLLTGNGLYLIATALSVLAMAVVFPRRSRLERWMEEATGQSGAGI